VTDHDAEKLGKEYNYPTIEFPGKCTFSESLSGQAWNLNSLNPYICEVFILDVTGSGV
jgi:hypothetical protein